jgi:hypothetical protein
LTRRKRTEQLRQVASAAGLGGGEGGEGAAAAGGAGDAADGGAGDAADGGAGDAADGGAADGGAGDATNSGITGLCFDHFIQSGESYFQPASGRPCVFEEEKDGDFPLAKRLLDIGYPLDVRIPQMCLCTRLSHSFGWMLLRSSHTAWRKNRQ